MFGHGELCVRHVRYTVYLMAIDKTQPPDEKLFESISERSLVSFPYRRTLSINGTWGRRGTARTAVSIPSVLGSRILSS